MDIRNLPRCTIDYPLDIVTEEIGTIAGQVNTLLKSTYLLGMSRDTEGTFQSLFDIAEEVAGIDCAAYLALSPDTGAFEVGSVRGVAGPREEEGPEFAFPARLARHFGKTVLLETGRHPALTGACERWGVLSLVAFPLLRDRDIIGSLVFGKRASHPFTPVQIKLLWILAMQADNYLIHSEAVKTLSFYSFLDPLTHLYNRRFFDDQLDREILRARRSGKPLSLLMLDLDGFKRYNDRFLHAAGDVALQEIAALLRDSVREVDTVARVGGDEFALVLVESTAEGARELARRIVERTGRHLLPGAGSGRTERLSTSIGIACFPTDCYDKQDLMKKADRALYGAKNQGGGRVCVYHEIVDLIAARPTGNDIPVQKIFEASRSVVDMDKFLEILLFTAMQGLSASRGSIVVTGPGDHFTLRAAIGFGDGEEHLATGASLSPGDVTSWVVDHGQPLVVTGQEDFPLPKPLRKNGYRTNSFLSIPLFHEGRSLGVLHLTNRRENRPFTRADLASFEPMAASIARILHQGMAFREGVRGFATSILNSLTDALELRFPFLSGHSGRVRTLALRVGARLGLTPDALSSLDTAAALHDVGIVGVPGNILLKKRRLNNRELEVARKHPLLGSRLLEGIPGVDVARRIIQEHHECFDGSGYPYGLRGDDILQAARVLAVAEFYDSIVSDRPHRRAIRPEEALQLVRNGASTLFDPDVTRAFVEEIGADPIRGH